MDFSFEADMMKQVFVDSCIYIQNEYVRPSILFKPDLSLDGDSWCALFGKDLQVGVCAFGSSPDEAMRNFDKAWLKPIEEGVVG